MRQRPALALLVTAAACLGVGVAVPSSAHLVAAESLGAVTTITATTSGTASLVLYDDATVSTAITRNPDVTISGKGRVVGFGLQSVNTANGFANDELDAVRLPAFAHSVTQVFASSQTPQQCSGYPNDTVPVQQECDNCTYEPSPMVPVQGSCNFPEPARFKLHEGYYTLTVLTDGSPVRITLRLHGVGKRKANVHMQSSFRSVETTLTQHESIGSSTVTFGGSASFPKADQILMFVGVKLHPNATALVAAGCLRSDTGTPPPYAYNPACPGGQTTGYSYEVGTPVAGQGGVGVFGLGLAPTGSPNGVGGSFVDTSGPTYIGGVAVWSSGASLPFGPTTTD